MYTQSAMNIFGNLIAFNVVDEILYITHWKVWKVLPWSYLTSYRSGPVWLSYLRPLSQQELAVNATCN
jgi:hypothetical protein